MGVAFVARTFTQLEQGGASMNQRVLLAIALAIPILALIAVAGMKAQQRASGIEVVLPIEGFDPRDLLSGHYLTYRVDYGIPTSCGEMYETQADLCLEPTRAVYPHNQRPDDCRLFLRGYCDTNTGFSVENLNRFYIPEEHAAVLDSKVRDKQGSLVLAVDAQGNAVIKDLLINGKPWRDALTSE